MVLSVIFVLYGCSSSDDSSFSYDRPAVESTVLQFSPLAEDAVTVTFQTSEGDITAVLYPELAPMACENFLELAETGYYNDTLFHRIKENFVIQGGDASGTGLGGDSIWNHPFFSEITPSLQHYSGALCMAPADVGADSLLSQFYIVASPAENLSEEALAELTAAGYSESVVDAYRQAGGLPYLDYTDTVFGQVVSGMDVVDRIAQASTNENDEPKEDIVLMQVLVKLPGEAQ